MHEHTCLYCEYKGRDSEFLSGCPTCCKDNDTGELIPNAVPTVFHLEKE